MPFSQEYNFPQEFRKYKGNFKAWASINGSLQIIIPNGYRYSQNFLFPFHLTDSGLGIKNYIRDWLPAGQTWDISIYEIPCNTSNSNPSLPERIIPNPPSVYLPPFSNPPPRKEKMDDCCRENL